MDCKNINGFLSDNYIDAGEPVLVDIETTDDKTSFTMHQHNKSAKIKLDMTLSLPTEPIEKSIQEYRNNLADNC